MQFLLIFLLTDHPPLTYGDYVYPAWSNVLSAMISLSIFICIPVYAVYGFCIQPGDALQVDRILHHLYNYIKRGKVSVRTYVRKSVTVGVASSVANDVTMRMTS